ncbi:hypothetical protein EVAR_68026_1 [Eumeta japonica]|uniref:Uncharacterized protein n=1 Tax=Eumeta variegata TaxID=151549 RepID=A0A4C1SV19_EUMVA|nr:hypothetical protein EVAR_68026_1 [Eumeta japonica]
MKYSTGVRTHQAGPRGEPSHIYDVPGMSGAYYVDRFPFTSSSATRSSTTSLSIGHASSFRRRNVGPFSHRSRSQSARVASSAGYPRNSPNATRYDRALVEFSEAVRYERLICPRVDLIHRRTVFESHHNTLPVAIPCSFGYSSLGDRPKAPLAVRAAGST